MRKKTEPDSKFSQKLLLWFKKNKRDLPWRKTRDPYKIWVAEVMLQQTTVAAVIPYYEKWLKFFPNIESLACSPLQKVLRVWQGLGYYERAKNLHQAAKIISKSYQGRVPQSYDELRRLPGFGPYTTAAVLSLAFDKPYPVIDANIRRVMMRIVRLHAEATPKNDKILLNYLSSYFPQKKAGTFNQALMELGSLVCQARNPLCLQCPIQEFCQAYKYGKQEIIPRPLKRYYRKMDSVVGIIQKEGKYLIQKRPEKGLLADLWEFPGGKRRQKEALLKALWREIKEELGVEIKKAKFLAKIQHAYTQFRVSLYVFECKLKSEPKLQKNQRWVSLSSLHRFPLPSGTARIVNFLKQRDT